MDPTEAFLRAAFEANFERLRQESHRSATPDVKRAALEQVLLYWRRLRDLAERVTGTEIDLGLPEQRSPAGRRYTLEGVVDIVEEGETTTMYDLKTYLDADAAREHIEPHFKQLSVYAHIWQTLRGRPLDAVAVVATRPTAAVRHALSTGDGKRIAAALAAWNPVIEVEVRQDVVDEVMADFGRVVDAITDGAFSAPDVEVLRAPARPGGHVTFGAAVCGNCDVRHGCDSHRQFALRARPAQRPEVVLAGELENYGTDSERDEWRDANLSTLEKGAGLDGGDLREEDEDE